MQSWAGLSAGVDARPPLVGWAFAAIGLALVAALLHMRTIRRRRAAATAAIARDTVRTSADHPRFDALRRFLLLAERAERLLADRAAPSAAPSLPVALRDGAWRLAADPALTPGAIQEVLDETSRLVEALAARPFVGADIGADSAEPLRALADAVVADALARADVAAADRRGRSAAGG